VCGEREREKERKKEKEREREREIASIIQTLTQIKNEV
jgi:hypothetical protein